MVICIDTNVVLGMLGHGGRHLPLRQALLEGRFHWAVSTEILLEYEEVAAREISQEAAANLMRFIELISQARGAIKLVSPDFRFSVIQQDRDDDKFADCAIVAQADFVITEDRHFRSLAGSGYRPQPITPHDFRERFL